MVGNYNYTSNFSYELELTNRQVENICKRFANNKSNLSYQKVY